MTNRQKIAYIRDRARSWKKKLNFDPKYAISVEKASSEAEDPDVVVETTLTEGTRIEEQIVTQLERSLLGEANWKRQEKIVKKNGGHGKLMDFDDSKAQYFILRIRVYSFMLSFNDDDFRLLADSCTLHEMMHGVLCPLALYVRHLEER